MVQSVIGIKENVFALLKHVFVDYAVQLRAQYPDRKIRNAAVFASGIPAFARLSYVELVDARKPLPKHILPYIAQRIKRASQPIWVPGKNFPRNLLDLDNLMQPYLHGDEVRWKHVASRGARRTCKR